MKYLLIFILTADLVFAQTDLNQSFKINKLNGNDSLKSDSKYQFSLGGGVRFHNHFVYADPIVNADFGFRLSKNFVLISGAEFWIHKYTDYYTGYGVEETKLYTSLFVAPSLFLQTKHFMFYAGGGTGMTLPSVQYGLHIFLLTRAGYKISEGTSINLSINLPMYLNGKVEGLSASAMYSFVF